MDKKNDPLKNTIVNLGVSLLAVGAITFGFFSNKYYKNNKARNNMADYNADWEYNEDLSRLKKELLSPENKKYITNSADASVALQKITKTILEDKNIKGWHFSQPDADKGFEDSNDLKNISHNDLLNLITDTLYENTGVLVDIEYYKGEDNETSTTNAKAFEKQKNYPKNAKNISLGKNTDFVAKFYDDGVGCKLYLKQNSDFKYTNKEIFPEFAGIIVRELKTHLENLNIPASKEMAKLRKTQYDNSHKESSPSKNKKNKKSFSWNR